MTAVAIIEKYEVPKEYWGAIFEAYTEGAKRGIIDYGISQMLATPQQSSSPDGSAKNE